MADIAERLSTDIKLRLAGAAVEAAELGAQHAFELVRRRNTLAFLDRWMGVLDVDSSTRGQLLSRALTAIMSEATLMAAACADVAEVGPISDATIDWITRLRT